jgi:hypothetical protein
LANGTAGSSGAASPAAASVRLSRQEQLFPLPDIEAATHGRFGTSYRIIHGNRKSNRRSFLRTVV